jgi:cytidyltransferase-like protein
VDAPLVAALQGLRREFDDLWVCPEQALLAPALTLESLRYSLAMLACVTGVLAAPESAQRGTLELSFNKIRGTVVQGRHPGSPDPDEPLPRLAAVESSMVTRPEPLVLVTGCFDLIHAGHLRLMATAARHSPRPVVAALTSAAIAAQPKNQGDRPFWSMQDRALVLTSLRVPLDLVFFDGPDSLGLIERLRPDVWVKEVQDRDRPIVLQEAALVERLGGRVAWFRDAARTTSSTKIAAVLSAIGR